MAARILVDCPDLYDREELYTPRGTPEYPDNARRLPCWFVPRSNGPHDAGSVRGRHGHDWQAGLRPCISRRSTHRTRRCRGTPSVFTIHNLAYQGLFDAGWLPRVDLGPEELAVNRLEFWGRSVF
jgi:starch synthase